MADRLSIDATGFAFLTQIDAAASKLERPSELMRLIGATMEQNIALRFVELGRRDAEIQS